MSCAGHGRCVRGECRCDVGWSGPFCATSDLLARQAALQAQQQRELEVQKKQLMEIQSVEERELIIKKQQAEAQFAVPEAGMIDAVRKVLARHGAKD
jgi:hypothetical protein